MYYDRPFYCHRDDNPNSSTNRTDLTFAMLDEWAWIREYLARFPEKESRLVHVYQFRKFHNCNFAFSKLADSLQLPYLERYSQELNDALGSDELDLSMFSKSEQKALSLLMANPSTYLKEYRNRRKRGQDLESARSGGAVSLFFYYLREEGPREAFRKSTSRIARLLRRSASR